MAMKDVDRTLLETHLRTIEGERTVGASDRHLAEVAQYVRGTLEGYGYETELDSFAFEGQNFENIIARKKGGASNGRIIVGAHFDSVPGSPGADDNASGVAALLELARMLAERPWNHTVEFIGFSMEEWNMIGSGAYVQKLKQKKIQVRGMISLEMLGYTSEKPGSQNMPLGFNLFYPTTGNFIGLVGNLGSRDLLGLFKSNMKQVDGLPVESLLLPFNGWPIPATRLSDHSPFWDAGYPALLITDTSFYRNPHYHGPTDTVETLNLDFLAKVTEGVAQALIALDKV